MSSTKKDDATKGNLKLKKGDLFKKKKKSVDPKMIDLTIKKDETSYVTKKTKAEIAFERRQQATIVSSFSNLFSKSGSGKDQFGHSFYRSTPKQYTSLYSPLMHFILSGRANAEKGCS